MTTIKDIAYHSGYSSATVSRLLKGDENLSITEETRQKIIHTALTLGYDRSKIKTTLEKIAVLSWISDEEELQDVYFRNLKINLEKYAKLNNMEIFTIKQDKGLDSIPKNISGFIALGSFSEKEIQKLKNSYTNGVFLEINPEPDYFDTVKPDTDRMTVKAIDYFREKGYQKIGFIGGEYYNHFNDTIDMDSREVTFRHYLSTLGLLNEKYILSEGRFSVEQGYNLVKNNISKWKDDLPEAIFIASDTIAIGCLQAFNELQIKIPDNIEIISINDNDISKFVSPPLTTFRIEAEEIAKTTIDMLVDQIVYNRKTTKTVLLNSELIIRKSFVPKT